MASSHDTNCYNEDEMREITTDTSTFEYFRTKDLLYVDKTMYVHSLVRSAARRFFFLSRPRRFGKSLFCSTLHALFDGRKDLFEGLYIEDKYSFEKFPVLHFNFAHITVGISFDEFLASFSEAVYDAGKGIGVEVEFRRNPAALLLKILRESMAKYGKGVALIIDEFDAPITTTINKGKSYVGDIRSVLNDFYSVIKNNGECIRFFFMTGVTKLSNLSIFSAMNNLVDISMAPEFAGAFGYTDEELEEYFGEGIDENWNKSCNSREGFREKIREYYDGYRFSPRSEMRVYNPVSIGKFFESGCEFDNFWIDTGSTTMATDLAKEHDLISIVEDIPELSREDFSIFDISRLSGNDLDVEDVYAFLYYSGYLTIRDSRGDRVSLGFPNHEIAKSFSGALVNKYTKEC